MQDQTQIEPLTNTSKKSFMLNKKPQNSSWKLSQRQVRNVLPWFNLPQLDVSTCGRASDCAHLLMTSSSRALDAGLRLAMTSEAGGHDVWRKVSLQMVTLGAA